MLFFLATRSAVRVTATIGIASRIILEAHQVQDENRSDRKDIPDERSHIGQKPSGRHMLDPVRVDVLT